jgi:tRNA(adenine34) deaminase
METTDNKRMDLALEEGRSAGARGEVPIGAVLVDQSGDIIARAHNRVVTDADPTAHAEILAIRHAARIESNYRLLNCALYVTVEPCIMCMGAIVHARIKRVVYGAPDPKWGAAGSLYDFAADRRLNHQPEILGGVMESECRGLLQAFFRCRRSGTADERNTAPAPGPR